MYGYRTFTLLYSFYQGRVDSDGTCRVLRPQVLRSSRCPGAAVLITTMVRNGFTIHVQELTVMDVSVSIVDGYNLPISITNSQGCPVADCPVDLGPNCEIG
jgi:hypothetical protein